MNRPQPTQIPLCTLEQLRDKRSLGVEVDLGDVKQAVFVVLDGNTVRGYVDRCPHRGTPLAWTPDNYLDSSGEHLICATHGALFSIENGRCIAGPCQGDVLEPIEIAVSNSLVVLIRDAESPPPHQHSIKT